MYVKSDLMMKIQKKLVINLLKKYYSTNKLDYSKQYPISRELVSAIQKILCEYKP